MKEAAASHPHRGGWSKQASQDERRRHKRRRLSVSACVYVVHTGVGANAELAGIHPVGRTDFPGDQRDEKKAKNRCTLPDPKWVKGGVDPCVRPVTPGERERCILERQCWGRNSHNYYPTLAKLQ